MSRQSEIREQLERTVPVLSILETEMLEALVNVARANQGSVAYESLTAVRRAIRHAKEPTDAA